MAETYRPTHGPLPELSTSDASIGQALVLPKGGGDLERSQERGLSATFRPTEGAWPDLPNREASDASIDQALTLLLADETEAALRWGAAVLERDPTCDALTITSQLLERMGRTRAATEGLSAALELAVDSGDLPLAVAAIDQLRSLGADVREPFRRVAETFCEDSPRLEPVVSPLLPHFDDFQPLSSFLSGPGLASKASRIVQAATHVAQEVKGAELPVVPRLPLFSALSSEALLDLLAAFEVITVPAGYRVIEKGELGTTAYIVARGELEVSRRPAEDKPPVVLARLGSGAFFGEMALLSDMPRAASVVAIRPSTLLVAERDALDAVSQRHPEVAIELAAHCRRRLVANLGRTSPVLGSLPPGDRDLLMDRFVTRVFRKGQRFVTRGEEVEGLHLIASGAVAIVTDDGGERVALATLSAGETVGEVELVLQRAAGTDAIALEPTATLFLSRESFLALVEDHPALVHGLYLTALRRDGETSQALAASSSAAGEYVLEDRELAPGLPPKAPSHPEVLAASEHIWSPPRTFGDAGRMLDEPFADSEKVPAETSGSPTAPSTPTTTPVEATDGKVYSLELSADRKIAAAELETVASEIPANASSGVDHAPAKPETSRPSEFPGAASGMPDPVTRSSGSPPSKRSVPPKLPSVPAAALVSPAVPSLAAPSSIAPSTASVPPVARRRSRRELPPVAIAAMFALAGVVAGSVVTQFGKHTESAAANGGGGPEGIAPAEIATVTITPAAPESASAARPAAPTTPPVTPPVVTTAGAPARASLVPAKPRAYPAVLVSPPTAVEETHPAPAGTVAAPLELKPKISATAPAREVVPTAGPTAAGVDRNPANSGTEGHDEFGGGRE
jgi:cAMP-dependent protein kinase regulator